MTRRRVWVSCCFWTILIFASTARWERQQDRFALWNFFIVYLCQTYSRVLCDAGRSLRAQRGQKLDYQLSHCWHLFSKGLEYCELLAYAKFVLDLEVWAKTDTDEKASRHRRLSNKCCFDLFCSCGHVKLTMFCGCTGSLRGPRFSRWTKHGGRWISRITVVWWKAKFNKREGSCFAPWC